LLKLYYKFNFATEPKKLNLDDTEEGDLIHTDDDEKADEDRIFYYCNVELGTEKLFY
jgi:plasmid rolling circle replication initiator protein Rep